MSRKTLLQLFAFLILSLLIVSCGNKPTAEENSNVAPVSEQDHATVTPDFSKPISPISPVSPPPPPTPTPRPQVKTPVILDEPIEVGDTSVSGTGPANVSIRIYEVANTADLLAEIIIAKDGTFSVALNRSLQPTERVGIILGDLEGTPFEFRDFRDIAIKEVPVYGYILADVSVQP